MVAQNHNYLSEIQIEKKMLTFDGLVNKLPGLADHEIRKTFVAQMAKASRELVAITAIASSYTVTDTGCLQTDNFDPLHKAVCFYHRNEFDEACWLLFLCSYIGKHPKQKWRLLNSIYHSLDSGLSWSWKTVSQDINDFCKWLHDHQLKLRDEGNFGEVHKHSMFEGSKVNTMQDDIKNYVHWVQSKGGHLAIFSFPFDNKFSAFDHLYTTILEQGMFSKQIIFNYLLLLRNLGIIAASPGHLYLNDSLWAKKGIKALVGNKIKSGEATLEPYNSLVTLARYVSADFGLQLLRTGLIEWAKSQYGRESRNFRRY